MTDRFPRVTGDIEGWTEADRRTETVFRLPTATIEGHTLLFEDERTGTEGEELDGPWRFFFATRLTFSPPLAPGIGPASVYPTVASESARSFADRLAERGFEGVDRGRSQRVRVDTGERARLRKYTARYEPPSGDPMDVEGWTAVWVHDGEFRFAGGAFPTSSVPGPGGDPSRFRDELLDLIRSVE
jgi:hypothetical protein